MVDQSRAYGPQGQATYGMANLRPSTTGLPFIVFISQRDSASHGSRVKVSLHARVRSDDLGSYSIEPFQHRAGPTLESRDAALLGQWISKNKVVLQDYWNGKIEYTEDAISQLVKL